jgi:hypothetical protein
VLSSARQRDVYYEQILRMEGEVDKLRKFAKQIQTDSDVKTESITQLQSVVDAQRREIGELLRVSEPVKTKHRARDELSS